MSETVSQIDIVLSCISNCEDNDDDAAHEVDLEGGEIMLDSV